MSDSKPIPTGCPQAIILELQDQIKMDREHLSEMTIALQGLMRLTAAAYAHQVTLVPEYNEAKDILQRVREAQETRWK